MAGNGVLFSGSLGGSNQGQVYSVPASTAAQPLPFTRPPYFNFGEIYPTGVAPSQPVPPAVSASFSADFTTSTSLPTQMALSRASSATYFDSSSVLQTATSNVARFDYDPLSHEERGLLIEEQRTNYAYQDFTLWGSSGSLGMGLGTATTDLAGGTKAWPLLMQAGTGTHQRFISSVIATTASPVTMSAYVKPAGYNKIAIRESATTGASAVFFLEQEGKVFRTNPLGSITGVVAGVQNVGNGWYRIWTTMTPSASIAWTIGFNIVDAGYTSGDPSSYSMTADGTSAIIACFPQLEIGAGVTSYIAVPSTTAITRSADIVSSTDATWLGYKGWVIETGEMIADAAATLLGINTAIGLGYTSGSVLTTADGGAQSTTLTEYSPARNRGAIGWDSTPRVSIALDGSNVTTAANTPVTPTALYFGNTNNGASGFLNGHIRSIGGYSTLADADLPSVSVVAASFTGTGASASGAGSSTGSNAATAVGAWLQSGVGSSTGANTTTGIFAAVDTWNPSDKDASITLSNGNLTATGTTADRSVRAVLPAPNGYFEITADVMGGSSTMAVGLTNLAHIMNIYLGWDQANAIEYRDNGAIVGTNTSTTGVATYTTGDIIGIWLKPDGSVSFYKNGTLQANRTDVPTGSLYPSATIGSSTDQLTANFGATTFNSLPATAIAWNTNAAIANVGASAGTNTATAVGAWLQAGVGSSAGANTSTAVGAWLQSGVGSSAGTDTATATATWLQSGVGSAAGTDTTTATGAKLQAGVGSSAGTNTTTGVGSDLQAGVGSSAGSNTTPATGHWLQSGVGNATGSNTASGFSAPVPGVGTSSGSNTATAVGAWAQAGVGSSAGSDTAAGVGADLQSGVGSSTGANASVGTGAWLQSGVGSSAGTDTATGVGSTASGPSVVSGTGLSVGGNIADGQSPASDFNFDFDASFGGYPGVGTGAGQGDFNTDFNDDFAVFHVGQVVSGTGSSVGGNIAEAVGSTIVFIPPVYPPPPPVPVKVWHPAQEYHRVQQSRANRTFRHGTELRRLAPQGMKRRYG